MEPIPQGQATLSTYRQVFDEKQARVTKLQKGAFEEEMKRKLVIGQMQHGEERPAGMASRREQASHQNCRGLGTGSTLVFFEMQHNCFVHVCLNILVGV